MSEQDDVQIVRDALYAATRGPDLSLAPVPGTPVGDAHLALDRLAESEAVRRQLAEALRLHTIGSGLRGWSSPQAKAALAASDALDAKEEA